MPDNRLFRVWIPVALSASLYVFIGYFTQREGSTQLLVSFGILALLFLWMMRSYQVVDFKVLLWGALGLRAILLIATPELSDDVFRFIWDGRMLLNGLNPFEHLPVDVVNEYPGLNEELFALLNSQDKYTIYPPVSQFVFWLSTVVSPNSILGSVIVMRVVILFAEAGTLLIMRKLLVSYGVPVKNLFFYAINPFVILEITGNLHFEGLMLFFVLLSIALIMQKRNAYGAIAMGMSIGVKLLPLILLPLFVRRLGFKNFLIFCVITGGTSLLLFFPLLSLDFLEGMSSSLELYFNKFEFNASIYYLVRQWDFRMLGYNNIAVIGPRMALLSGLLIVGYSIYEYKNKKLLFDSLLWVLFIYFIMATTVHPWYVVTLVGISIFTRKRWPIAWSLLIFVTYLGYHTEGYSENYILIALEYIGVLCFIIYDLTKREPSRIQFAK